VLLLRRPVVGETRAHPVTKPSNRQRFTTDTSTSRSLAASVVSGDIS
jgi:hypothetical protein